MKFTGKVLPRRFKQVVGITGLLLALPGVLITFGYLCTALIVLLDNDREALIASLFACGSAMFTLGTGVTLFWHSLASLKGKVSKTFQLPSMRVLIIGLVLYWVLGVIIFENNILAGLFLSPSLILAIAILPLVAVIWFIDQQPNNISWRRASSAFMSSATLCLILMAILQITLLIIFSLLETNPFNSMINYLRILNDLLKRDLLSRYRPENQLFIIAQITIVIPLMATMVKSLVTLPLIGQLSRRDTFLIGAIAGAGYAALEGFLYVGIGIENWIWILVGLTIGAAIHPFGGGLIAIGWRDFITSKSSNRPNWLAYFGIVAALHILWNLGFFTLFILNPSHGFGVDLLVFVFLVGLGASSFWIGRIIIQRVHLMPDRVGNISNLPWFEMENRSLAVWALSSLLAIVSVGVFTIRFVF